MAKVISPIIKCVNAGKLDTALRFSMFKIATFNKVFELCRKKWDHSICIPQTVTPE